MIWQRSIILHISMKRFEYVHPAGGNIYISVKLTPEELENASGAIGWVMYARDGKSREINYDGRM